MRRAVRAEKAGKSQVHLKVFPAQPRIPIVLPLLLHLVAIVFELADHQRLAARVRSAAVWLNSHGAGADPEGELNQPGAGAEPGNPQPAGLNSPQDGATTLAANEPRHESPSKRMFQVPHSFCAK